MKFSKKATKTLACEPALVYDVLTDYDTYVEWFPHIGTSKLLAKEGDLAIAEFEFLKPQKHTMTVECIHDRNRLVLARTIAGTIPVTKLEWNLSGSGGRCEVSVSIEAKLSLRGLLPGMGDFINVEKLLRALETQMTAFAPEMSLADGGEKILELVETEAGPVLYWKGKKYALKEMGAAQ